MSWGAKKRTFMARNKFISCEEGGGALRVTRVRRRFATLEINSLGEPSEALKLSEKYTCVSISSGSENSPQASPLVTYWMRLLCFRSRAQHDFEWDNPSETTTAIARRPSSRAAGHWSHRLRLKFWVFSSIFLLFLLKFWIQLIAGAGRTLWRIPGLNAYSRALIFDHCKTKTQDLSDPQLLVLHPLYGIL